MIRIAPSLFPMTEKIMGQFLFQGAHPTENGPFFQTGLFPIWPVAAWHMDWLSQGDISETVYYESAKARLAWRTSGPYLWGTLRLKEHETLLEGTDLGYRELFSALAQAGFVHLIRTWHYLPEIHGEEAGLERYRQFNRGRRRAFEAVGLTQTAHYPAASVLGRGGAGWEMAFLAASSPGKRIENPRQTPADHYPVQYGIQPPLFSRAMLSTAGEAPLLLISGTASIVGHATAHPGDVVAQTDCLLDNLTALVEAANREEAMAGFRPFDVSSFAYLCYVRHRADASKVLPRLQRRLGNAPIGIVQAEICRTSLLVEIEATGQTVMSTRGAQ